MKEYKLIFSIYLSILFVFIVFFLSAVHNSPVNNSMHEWVINYQGGFTRRGLLGEIIFQITQIFNFQLKKGFLILQILLYAGYFLFIYIFFKKIKFNYFFALAIFSPLFFVFSLAELEALGRKDILMFLVFLGNFLIYSKFKNVNYNYFYFIISFPIVFLTHEIYLIYTVYFLAFFLIVEKKLNLIFFIKYIFIICVVIFFIDLITSNKFSKEEIDLLCEKLKIKSNIKCGLAPYSMMATIADYKGEVSWQKSHIARYILIFLFGFIGLFIILFFSKINQENTNKFISIFNIYFGFIILMIPSILPFLTAVDSGRYMSMAYTFPCIFYFGLLKSDLIIFNYEKANSFIENSILKLNKYKFIILFLLCFSWTPKAVYHEDIGSFPLYRTLIKTTNFIDNFKNFKSGQL